MRIPVFLAAADLAGATVAAAQKTQYTAASTPLLTAAGGSSLGTLAPATPVKVLKTSGKFSQISVQGWSTQKGPKSVYTAMGERINVLTLSDAKAPGRKVLKSATDNYKANWDNVEVTGWVDSSKLAADPKPLWTQASGLYAKGCGTCHAAHEPAVHTANEWIGVMKGMAPRSTLSKDQVDLVLKYLQSHAKK